MLTYTFVHKRLYRKHYLGYSANMRYGNRTEKLAKQKRERGKMELKVIEDLGNGCYREWYQDRWGDWTKQEYHALCEHPACSNRDNHCGCAH